MLLFNKKNTERRIKKIRDKPLKSAIKAISWRVVGTADTVVLSYFITGKFNIALSIGSIEVVTKMCLYFLHERLWGIIRWSRFLVFIRRNTRLI